MQGPGADLGPPGSDTASDAEAWLLEPSPDSPLFADFYEPQSGTITHVIPDFQADDDVQTTYVLELERQRARYLADAEETARAAFSDRSTTIESELDVLRKRIEDRKSDAQYAVDEYKRRFPARTRFGRPTPPTFFDNVRTFGGAWRLYRSIGDAIGAVTTSRMRLRKLKEEAEELRSELRTALADARSVAQEHTESAQWLEELADRDFDFRVLKQRNDDIVAERAAYEKRLRSGRVSDEEIRDRYFAEHRVKPISLPLIGVIFYRIVKFGRLSYFLLRDLDKLLYALPYEERLELVRDYVFDIFEGDGKIEARPHLRANSHSPMSLLDHFVECSGNRDAAAWEAYNKRREWMAEPSPSASMPEDDSLESAVRAALRDTVTVGSPERPSR
jgi:hypothetical protein